MLFKMSQVYVEQNVHLISLIVLSLLLLFLCLGQHSADKSSDLPHSVSHPVSLWQRQQLMSRPGTITPHLPVYQARRTGSRYK